LEIFLFKNQTKNETFYFGSRKYVYICAFKKVKVFKHFFDENDLSRP